MKRTIETVKLTKDFIESRVSQEAIVSKYLNIPIDVVINCIEHNTLITSVFRDDDKNKSMGIQYNIKGRLKVRDFGGFGFFGDVYDVVGYVLSLAFDRKIEPNNKQDFYFILKHICSTFSDVIDNKVVDPNVEEDIVNGLRKVKNNRVLIDIVPRSWNKQDKDYWNHLGVSLGYLNTHFVIPVEQYYLNRSIDTEPKYIYKAKDPCYAYMLGQDRRGVYLIKLYFPNRDRKNKTKFITNCNVIEGLPNLELDNYDYILITKSSKDRLSIGSHLSSNLLYGGVDTNKIGIVNLPSESYELKENEYNYLKSKLSPNGLIISLLDFDTTGRHGAKYMYDNYDIPYMFITRGEFGLYNYKAKDFSDLHDIYTIEEINNFIKETFTYVRLKYKTVQDTDASVYGVSDNTIPYY